MQYPEQAAPESAWLEAVQKSKLMQKPALSAEKLFCFRNYFIHQIHLWINIYYIQVLSSSDMGSNIFC